MSDYPVKCSVCGTRVQKRIISTTGVCLDCTLTANEKKVRT